MEDLRRLSLNQITTQRWSVAEAVAGCREAGIQWISLWRDKVAATGLAESARLVREAELSLSSLCRGGMFPAATAAERQKRIDDNRRAIDEAAALGSSLLVLVCGPAPDRDLDGARTMVEDALAVLVPHAGQRGVRLGIEPLHPMYAAERSVVVTLGQANALVRRLRSPQVGVVVDVYHVWWDPELYAQIAAAAGTILGFHVSDWLVPTTDLLMCRGMMGDGVIELPRIRAAVEAAGYDGPIEVEIFNQAIWDTPGAAVLTLTKERFLSSV